MMSMRKVLLSLMLTVGLLAVKADNFTAVNDDGVSIKYSTLSDTECKVTSSSNATVINIPSEVVYEGNTYTVVEIGNYAFQGSSSVEEVNLPNTITKIASGAFSLSGLKKINLPVGITKIESSTFRGCENLEEAIIPEGVTFIGSDAYGYCSSLKNLVLPESLTMLDEHAFRSCTGLENVTFNAIACVNRYGASMSRTPFTSAKIQNLRFGDKVKSIDVCMFYCVSISNCVFPESLETIGRDAFYGVFSGKNVVIPASVTEIGDYALSCSSNNPIQKMVIYGSPNVAALAFPYVNNLVMMNQEPPTITSWSRDWLSVGVPEAYFSTYCNASVWSNLYAAYPDRMYTLPDPGEVGSEFCVDGLWYAVTSNDECKLIAPESGVYSGEITVPAQVASDGQTYAVTDYDALAFEGYALTVINLPSTIMEFKRTNGNRLLDAPSLEAVNVSADNPALSSVDGIVYNKDVTELIYYPQNKAGDYVTPPTLTHISAYLGSLNRLTSLEIADNVTGNVSLRNDDALVSAVIGDGITGLFIDYCKNLETLVIGTGISSFATNCFKGCYKLNKLVIKDSPTPLTISYLNYDDGYGGMFGETKIRDFYMGRNLQPGTNNPNWSKMPFGSYGGNIDKFSVGPYVDTMLENMMKSTANASQKCFDSFDQWLNMKWLGTSYNSAGLEFGGVPVTEMTIPEGATLLSDIFTNCQTLEVVNLPASLAISSTSYYGLGTCYNLREINVGEGNESVYSIDGVLYSNNGVLLKYPPQHPGAEFVAPDDITTIGIEAFARSQYLTSITFPVNVNCLDDGIFRDAKQINTLIIIHPNISFYRSFRFTDVNKGITVYVPIEYKDAYVKKLATYEFKDVLGLAEDGHVAFALNHGTAFTNEIAYEGVDVTYTRKFNSVNWQGFYLPYNMPYEDWAEYGKVARLVGVEGTSEAPVLKWETVTSGTLTANTPYIFKPVEATDVTFTSELADLEAAAEESVSCSGSGNTFTITGIYQEKTDMATSGAYGMANGEFRPAGNDTQTLKPYLIYLTISSAHNAPMRISCTVDDEACSIEDIVVDAADGRCYDLMGREVKSLNKGIVIKNNHKVLIK